MIINGQVGFQISKYFIINSPILYHVVQDTHVLVSICQRIAGKVTSEIANIIGIIQA